VSDYQSLFSSTVILHSASVIVEFTVKETDAWWSYQTTTTTTTLISRKGELNEWVSIATMIKIKGVRETNGAVKDLQHG